MKNIATVLRLARQQSVVKQVLTDAAMRGTSAVANYGYAFAPANLALCKYWGKRDWELNLPVTSSFSISMGMKGTFTLIAHRGKETTTSDTGADASGSLAILDTGDMGQDIKQDLYLLNGQVISPKTSFARRLHAYLDLFRPNPNTFYVVKTISTVPVAAGLASSASGYAALIQALNRLYGWDLSLQQLSILARLGSGSACRSLWHGFAEWHCGSDPDGMDSYATTLVDNFYTNTTCETADVNSVNTASSCSWPDLRIGILFISKQQKIVSSREAMLHTVKTSSFYQTWPTQVAHDLDAIKQAVVTRNFELFGSTAEYNSLAMHALMAGARPPVIYSQPATLAAMQRVWDLRRAAIPVFFTQDAGPNLKLLFLASEEVIVTKAFPDIEIIRPFIDIVEEQLILVDEHDREIGVAPKMMVHLNGQLHRAFSILIFRERNKNIEVLLQQRSADKYHSADLWTNTCCGHPRFGEDIAVAAHRRLREEMGIVTDLYKIGAFNYCAKLVSSGLIEHEIDHIFIGTLSASTATLGDSVIKSNVHEVQDHNWVELNFLCQDLSLNPIKYTPWLPKVLIKFKQNLMEKYQ